MTTEPSTTLPSLHERIFEKSALLASVGEAAKKRGALVTVGRAGPGVRGFLLAYLAQQSRRPMLFIAPGADQADQTRRDWSTFLGQGVLEFPAWESLFDADSEPDADTYSLRSEALEALDAESSHESNTTPLAMVATIQALVQPISRSGEGGNQRFMLRQGDYHPTQQLARALVQAGFRRFPQVARPGDFSIRGGIFDIYPREATHPYRIEFFGEEIDSIRAVSLKDQRSRDEVPMLTFQVLPKEEYFIRGFTGSEVTLLDRLPEDAIVCVSEPGELYDRSLSLIRQWENRRSNDIAAEFWRRSGKHTQLQMHTLPPEAGRQPILLPSQSVEQFCGDLERVLESLNLEERSGTPIRALFRGEAEVERFGEILAEGNVGPGCRADIGDLSTGFRWNEGKAADGLSAIFLAGGETLGRSKTLARRGRKLAPSRAVDSFVELEPGDLVVHVSHGIGRFRGMRDVTEGARRGDHLVVEFRDGVHVLVPAERIDLVQKYVGGATAPGRLDRVGSTSWSKRKERASAAVHDLAAEMLEVQALREEREGSAFAEDTHLTEEFEAAFPFDETQDQLLAIEAIRTDLQSKRPMDRLVCGDVGYGKTELAMRAAFKVVQEGKQVAVLVPTTVLSQQHMITFRDRMAGFPVTIESLSRYRSRREQTDILQRAEAGEVDILIGTHRLLSDDVVLRDLGLIVIDEEQKFGVVHKEKLKQLRRLVDILTLTATPIPRTLHMSLMGLRDISSLQEAPHGRRSVKSEVCQFDEARFRKIILRELNRDGQIFWVHNRVHSIENRMRELQRLVPEADIVFCHGQLNEHELEERMGGFLDKKYNILVTTTIIESGLDIPSANTIIVERADRFGLAELHQLRGRVGRDKHQAYAYFLLPDDRPTSPEGRKRLQAIEEFSSLGAGFQIAMRDLEIRGAGNMLGREQSGHISTIGYDMYCRLLERAVARLRGVASQEPPDVDVNVPGHCLIPEDYISNTAARLRVYRAVATTLDEFALKEIKESLEDRYGALPETTLTLLHSQLIRIVFGGWGARRVSLEDGWVLLQGSNPTALVAGFQKLSWEHAVLPAGAGVVGRSGDVAPEDISSVARGIAVSQRS